MVYLQETKVHQRRKNAKKKLWLWLFLSWRNSAKDLHKTSLMIKATNTKSIYLFSFINYWWQMFNVKKNVVLSRNKMYRRHDEFSGCEMTKRDESGSGAERDQSLVTSQNTVSSSLDTNTCAIVHVHDHDHLLTMEIKWGRLINYIPENASITNGQLDVS